LGCRPFSMQPKEEEKVQRQVIDIGKSKGRGGREITVGVWSFWGGVGAGEEW